MGQLDVLKFLHYKGADLFRVDVNGESGNHWAARQGHNDVIEFLYQQGLSVNAPNKAGDTPLHLAAKQGHAKTIQLLCRYCSDINQTNEEGETALHLAAMRGHLDTLRCLIDAGADPDVPDKHGCTPLHLALRRHHAAVAIMLLQSGCNIDVVDNLGEAPIHIVAREGLLPLAQTLCAFGCKVEIPNKLGQYPLHLAARNGHTEMVRCLCLAGCDVELKNKDGIAAEITALAQGYNEMAELLNKLRNVHLREEFISQLIPSTHPISKIKLKLFGHSGVGKSTFAESLKCGYFTSWFRRSVGSMSPKVSRHKKGDSTNKSSIELNSSGPGDTQLSFETNLDSYTRGIDIQQVNISGIGDISIWEFSGHEPYYIVYDNFIGNTNCLNLIFFRLNDPYEVQVQQVNFWLAFLQSRIPPQEPLGYCGKSGKAARVALIATHADTASCHRVAATGEYVSSEASSVLRAARQKFGKVFDLHETVFVLDAHVVGSPAVKALRSYVAHNKEKVTQGLPKSTGFLEAVCNQLPDWRKSNSSFPAVQWKEFIALVHSEINPLSGEEHMKELIQQLQIMGEVVYIACENYDLVILDPSWICGTVLGHLLSQESLDRARVTGIYSADDVQLLFPEADGQKLLSVLEALQLCTACETDGEVEYEFPCFNLVETLDGLWAPSSSRYSAYGGVRLTCKHKHLLASLFPRLQVHLRRSSKENADSESDLYQWYRGSKFCSGLLEGMITLDDLGTDYELKVRGPASMRTECFFFQEDLISVIEQMFADVCPGLLIERHILSSSQLQAHPKQVFAYPPVLIMRVLLQDGVYGVVVNGDSGVKETLLALLFFGAQEVLLSTQHRNSPDMPNKREMKLSQNAAKIPHSHTTPVLQSQFLQSLTYPRRQSMPQQINLPRSLSQSFSSQFFQNRLYNLQERADSSPALLQEQNPSVILISDLHASLLPLLCCQCLCAVLDPQEPMGRDWCMLGVLLGMTDKLPKLDPGDNPAFSPTACIVSEWVKRPDSTMGQLLKKLEELERIDAVESLMSTLPLFRVVPAGFNQSFKELESDVINSMQHSASNL